MHQQTIGTVIILTAHNQRRSAPASVVFTKDKVIGAMNSKDGESRIGGFKKCKISNGFNSPTH